jgi:hypothetical protein
MKLTQRAFHEVFLFNIPVFNQNRCLHLFDFNVIDMKSLFKIVSYLFPIYVHS